MVHSMTAFARVEQAGTHGTLSWELRSVNHRYLEPHLRLPDAFRDLEGAVREALRQGLSRGKVECTLRFAEETAGKSLQVDQERARQLGAAGRRLDFLMQELNREANTLGSKAFDPRSTQAAVNLKVLIEQMREQVQNIE